MKNISIENTYGLMKMKVQKIERKKNKYVTKQQQLPLNNTEVS